MSPGLRRLYSPRSVGVETTLGSAPTAVDGVAVDDIREEWVVEDRWWEPKPLRRRYFELALVDGRAIVVFRSALSRRWYRQRA